MNQWDDPSQHDIPRPTEANKAFATAEANDLEYLEREPEGKESWRVPNYYISPFLQGWLKGELYSFLQQYQDTPWSPNSEDSWEWTVEEARRLFQKLDQ